MLPTSIPRIRFRSFTLPAAIATAMLLAAPARAAVVEAGGGDVPPVSGAAMGKVAVRRGVQGPAGLFTARVSLLINASKDSFGKPISLAPDLYYAFSDTVQLGLVHTGPMGWQAQPGVGLCLTGKSNGCPHVYDNVGLDFMYGLLFGDFHLSLHSMFLLEPIADPMGVYWTLGFAGKVHFTDTVALFFDPQVGISLKQRELHKDLLFVPLELQLQATPTLAIKLLTGVTGQLSSLGDTYRVPVGLGLVANLNPHFDLGLRFSFDNLLGKQAPNVGRADERSIGLLLIFRS